MFHVEHWGSSGIGIGVARTGRSSSVGCAGPKAGIDTATSGSSGRTRSPRKAEKTGRLATSVPVRPIRQRIHRRMRLRGREVRTPPGLAGRGAAGAIPRKAVRRACVNTHARGSGRADSGVGTLPQECVRSAWARRADHGRGAPSMKPLSTQIAVDARVPDEAISVKPCAIRTALGGLGSLGRPRPGKGHAAKALVMRSCRVNWRTGEALETAPRGPGRDGVC
jgi:hypothetical protein